MPVTNFSYGYYNSTDNTAFYQPLLNISNLYNSSILFSLDFPGIGLPVPMYQQFAQMTQNITNFDMNCTGYDNTWPLN